MRWLTDNWSLLAAILAAVAVAVIRVRQYMRLSKEEQDAVAKAHKDALIQAVTDWLLRGVTEAEKDLGAGTGKLKIRAAYERAIEIFGAELAEILTLEQFDALAQAPLEEMRNMLAGNQSAAAYVSKEE